MTADFKMAIDGIRAEDTLKTDTIRFLQREIARRNSAPKPLGLKRVAVMVVSLAVVFLAGFFAHGVYFTPSAYVDVDVNPSVELVLNSFDRVIDAYAYNEEGAALLSGLNLTHRSYESALIELIDTMNGAGFIQNNGLVSVTLQTENRGREKALLTSIQTDLAAYMAQNHHSTQVDVFPVSGGTREIAHEEGLSPAKYIAIQELIEVDPTASVESCRGHSISEIRQMTRAHGTRHGESQEVPQEEENSGVENGAGYGNGHGGGHHGGHG